MISQHLPVLIVAAPLTIALFISVSGWFSQRLSFPLAVIGLAGSSYFSIELCFLVLEQKEVLYKLGGWSAPFGIEYKVDHLNILVLILIPAVALLNLLNNRQEIEDYFKQKSAGFLSLYLLFVSGLNGMVVTADVFNLYVLLEITALSGYALVGAGRDEAPLAGLNYIFMGTVGASFYLLGVGYLYMATGSLNMGDLSSILPSLYDSKVVLFAFVICLVGLFVKMALFPLHVWLPSAYSSSPPAARGLVAPLTTKVMIYVMIRLSLSVFGADFVFSLSILKEFMVWISIATIFFGVIWALRQQNLFKILCYLLIGEIGYMTGGFWLGNAEGITGAILHVVNDAAMILCLFMAAGNITSVAKGENLSDLKGILKRMPITTAIFILTGFSLIGVPPACGFFSKWYLVSGAIRAGHYAFVVALLFSSLATVVIFFRIIEAGYFGSEDGEANKFLPKASGILALPFGRLITVAIAGGSLILLGLFTKEITLNIIRFALPDGY